MCGRYSLSQLPEDLEVIWPEDIPPEWQPRYNIAPSQWCPVIHQDDQEHIYLYRWGLIPYWAKDIKIGYKMINARAETLWEKAGFKRAIQKSRCIIPSDGFYEWKKGAGKQKQPYRICLKSEEIMYFAGLSEVWKNPDGKKINSFSIITTEPNELMADIHNRMPVILPHNTTISTWLNPYTSKEELQNLLRPCDTELLKAYPVSPSLGNVKNEGEHLIQPWQPPTTLF